MQLDEVRSHFPITETRAYLFSGGLAPAARQVKAAIDEWVDKWMYDPAYHRTRYFIEWELVRQRLATLLGAEPDEIAIVDNTARGSNLIVQMTDAPPGSNIVVDRTTYPSSYYPWQLGEKRHVEIRRVEPSGDHPTEDDFAQWVDERTVALSVSHVSPVDGFRHDLPALAEVAHRAGAYLIVDVAQSAGVIDVNVQSMGIDFLCGTAMKWLLGPPGIGFMYVKRQHLERLEPPHAGRSGCRGQPGGSGPVALQTRRPPP